MLTVRASDLKIRENRKLVLKFESEREKIPVVFDPDKMEKVFYNLIYNAFKFTSENGDIIVSVKVINNKVEIIVKDNGIGISQEDQKYIFESFYKVDKSRTLKGSGLGLAITKKIVRLHEGAIHVESKSDQGTTFTVTLPIQKNRTKKDSSV